MTRWNVLAGVVALVDADTAEEARAKLDEQLRDAGFSTHSLDDMMALPPRCELAFRSEE